MEFGSLDACLSYIKGAIADSMPELAEESKEIMVDVTRSQVGGISGDMFNSPQVTEVGADSCTMEFLDNGGWTSAIYNTPFFAMYGLEGGHTWNRSATTLYDTSCSQIQAEAPSLFLRLMLSQGIPIS